MIDSINRFYNSLDNTSSLSQAELIDFFVYFLTIENDKSVASPKGVKECFELCDLHPPARIPAHLSEGTRSNPLKFIKKNGGYRLERGMREKLAAKLGVEKRTVQTSTALRKVENKFKDGAKKDFLKELIDCFEAGANRAAVVMCWILAVDHLTDHIFNHKLSAFNTALAKNKDKRIKIKQVVARGDFEEIPEGKLIELCRGARIISNDVRKILEEKLGTRNSSAHPSSVQVKKSKVIDFVEDLVENVVLKYPD